MSGSVTRKKHINMTTYIDATTDLTIDEAAAIVEGQAVQLVPVDTGTLRSSIYRKNISPVESEVGATADYAVYQEFGTRRQQAQPFLRPALDELRNRLARIWENQSKKAKR